MGVPITAFCCLETAYSWSVISWQREFQHAIAERGEVRPVDLVHFKWDRVYVLATYEPVNADDNALIFPKTSLLDPFWWKNNQNYWTVAYTRPGRFLIKMERRDWAQRQFGYVWSSDRNAKLRLVTPGTIEATWCASGPWKCLALDDSRNAAPTVPRH